MRKPCGYWKSRIVKAWESGKLLSYTKENYNTIITIALRMKLKGRSIGYGKGKMRVSS